MMDCAWCGEYLWFESVLKVYRADMDGDIEPRGGAHARHLNAEEKN